MRTAHFAFCPELQGCYAQGNSYDEALDNLREAIALHVEDRGILTILWQSHTILSPDRE
jgi:predicted RNase H-like HicB family nuclease